MVGLFSGCVGGNKGKDAWDFAKLREKMVEQQIERRGIKDKSVLKAMRTVERHRFVPEAQQSSAYNDYPLPIGEGQTISQPYIVALMTQLLALDKKDTVLEVGTGSGYQAAVLAELAKEVYTIEIIEPLGKSAQIRLKDLNYDNVEVRIGDGYAGWPEHAPFDGIIVTCACPSAPKPLVEQLAEGGRMVIPIGGSLSYQMMTLFEKRDGLLHKKEISGCVFVPLLGPHGWQTERGD
ncbi:MAG: protein-L-isoaspartate(D-aspartate) O-methyltransferase [Candidatus Coatesbacteria bacterium]|nr:protein-L-isoaspartate(D-aspartate) O-methyltransferase [Candidatus Coatesbacteria bacterium]